MSEQIELGDDGDHTCHARRCARRIPPAMLMCPRHWFMVPPILRRKVWAEYRPGQEIDKRPTMAYLVAADAAVNAVDYRERAAARS